LIWARAEKLHDLDFNPTYFSHPKAADGFTLGHPDKGIRNFWIEHGIACRAIGTAMGKQRNITAKCIRMKWLMIFCLTQQRHR